MLPEKIGELKQLKTLKLEGCSNIIQLPKSIGQLEELQSLNLDCEKLIQLPDSIVQLKLFKNCLNYLF